MCSVRYKAFWFSHDHQESLSFTKEKDIEYEILFCHHCDDSLAGHRQVP